MLIAHIGLELVRPRVRLAPRPRLVLHNPPEAAEQVGEVEEKDDGADVRAESTPTVVAPPGLGELASVETRWIG